MVFLSLSVQKRSYECGCSCSKSDVAFHVFITIKQENCSEYEDERYAESKPLRTRNTTDDCFLNLVPMSLFSLGLSDDAFSQARYSRLILGEHFRWWQRAMMNGRKSPCNQLGFIGMILDKGINVKYVFFVPRSYLLSSLVLFAGTLAATSHYSALVSFSIASL